MVKKLFFLFFLMPLFIFGQYGVKLGVSNSKIMYDSQGIERSDLTGLRGGFFYRFKVNSRLSIQPEIYYVEKGVNLAVELVGREVADAEIMRKYLEFPVILRFNLLKRKYLHFDVFFGGYYAYNLSSKQKIKYQNNSFTENLPTRKSDLGYTTGGIVSLFVGKGELLFDFRFTSGLLDTRKDSYKDTGNRVKNSTFSLMAGYSF